MIVVDYLAVSMHGWINRPRSIRVPLDPVGKSLRKAPIAPERNWDPTFWVGEFRTPPWDPMNRSMKVSTDPDISEGVSDPVRRDKGSRGGPLPLAGGMEERNAPEGKPEMPEKLVSQRALSGRIEAGCVVDVVGICH